MKKRAVKQLFRQYLKLIIGLAILCAAFQYIPCINDNVHAICRLTITAIVLPLLNCEHLYVERCLVSKASPHLDAIDDVQSISDQDTFQCAVCENLGEFNVRTCCPWTTALRALFMCRHSQLNGKKNKIILLFPDQIDRHKNITAEHLQSVYISRDVPVIVADSHKPWMRPIAGSYPDDFIGLLDSLPSLRHTTPCNCETNLLSTRTAKLGLLLNRIGHGFLQNWMLHFRLCEFAAIKASRAILPTSNRPYFIPAYWPPFKSSWLLLSHRYEAPTMKTMPLNGFVIVLQLKGTLYGRLELAHACIESCAEQAFQLAEGEALLFTSDVWKMRYSLDAPNDGTITFIQEIEFN